MPTRAGTAQRSSVPESTLLRGRVSRATTIILQYKVRTSTLWAFAPALEYLITAPLKLVETQVYHPVLTYIVEKMKENSGSLTVKYIRFLNDFLATREAIKRMSDNIAWRVLIGDLSPAAAADFLMKLESQGVFGAVEAPASFVPDLAEDYLGISAWDYKPDILKEGWGYGQLIDFAPIGKKESVSFFYDIWSNIHYGYVGRAAGFSESELLSGADRANIWTSGSIDGVSDKTAIRIGIDLYNEGCMLTAPGLLQKLYPKRKCFNTWTKEDGFRAGSC
jgi:Bacterial toxin 44